MAGDTGAAILVPQTVFEATGLVDGDANEAKEEPPWVLDKDHGGEDEAAAKSAADASDKG